MSFGCVGARRAGLVAVAGLVGLAATFATTTSAEARRYPKKRVHHVARQAYAPPFSALVVDANTGRTMHAVAADELRHPASVTKVMTLYLLFEQLERGNLALDTELKVSSHAAAQAPSKLGLRPGGTIEVEDAIKALVTKSANDAAATIAENISGSESAFADRMTRKARQLGMSSTIYRNASGLPNPEQVTTARDLAILARAIQERFPKFYRYFQTRSFEYAGRVIGNHNRLLGRVEGVDGIKTGFTNASGFNLMTSARLDGRHVVGIVLGGRSGASRDATMANLIRTNIARAATGGNASVFADAGQRRSAVASRARQDDDDVETTATVTPAPRPAELATRAPVRLASAAPEAVVATVEAETEAAAPLPPSIGRKIDARLPAPQVLPPAPPARAEALAARLEPAREATRAVKAEPPRPEPRVVEERKREADKAPASVSPWVIQLAAEGDESKARDLLEEAKSKSGRLLRGAAPFTEKIVRGGTTLYRARFSGFDEADSAQEACKSLKRNGFSCFATRS